MSIDGNAIMMEVESILNSTTPTISYMYKATLHTENENIEILKVKDIIRLRDYANNKSDKTEIVVMVGIGTYNNVIRKHRGNLELTLYRSETEEKTAVEFIGSPISVERFIAIPPEEKESSMYDSLSVDVKPEDADKVALIDVSLELISPTITRLRAISTSGIYQAKNVGELLLALMTRFSAGIEIDREKAVRGVDLIPGYNATSRDSYVIPSNVNLVDLPRYIHLNCGGVYSAGLGWYLQNYLWFIYPLYDTTRFDKERDTLTVILLPSNKMPYIRNSFRKTNNQLTVLINNAPNVVDDTESIQFNIGNGVRFADGNRIMDGLGTANNNKYTIDKRDNVYEVAANNRKTGINMAPVISDRISENPFVEFSRLARGNTIHVQFEWINSDDSLLYPGMPTRIVRWVQNDVKEEFGTLLASETFNLIADTALSDRYVQRTVLTVGVAKKH